MKKRQNPGGHGCASSPTTEARHMKVDDFYNKCNQSLLQVKDLSKRMLTGVASKYGKNSSEYEMAGGTRKSERKKPVAKKPTA